MKKTVKTTTKTTMNKAMKTTTNKNKKTTMNKTKYTYSLATIYQFEYAIYLILSNCFKSVTCDSNALETLRLYYADLIKINGNGNYSYTNQEEMEEECEILIKNGLAGRINMPPFHTRNAKVTISRNADGTHSFTFRSGVYYFTYRLVFVDEEENEEEKKRMDNNKQGFIVKNRMMFLKLTDTWNHSNVELKSLPKKGTSSSENAKAKTKPLPKKGTSGSTNSGRRAS